MKKLLAIAAALLFVGAPVAAQMLSPALRAIVQGAPPAAGADVTAPVLSSYTDDPGADDRWGELSVSTDEGNGTMFWIVQAEATATPSSAQVVAGQDGASAAAIYASNEAVGSAGVVTQRATGLTGATAYESCAAHRDTALNVSSVACSTFTTDTLVASRVTDGLATNMTCSTGCSAFTTAQSDSDGGSNAISYVDNNDSTTGAVLVDMATLTFFNGVNRFRFKVKNSTKAAAAMWLRFAPVNTTIVSNAHFDITNGTVGTESWIGTPTITSLGSGWWQVDGSLDMTGADVAGAMRIQMGDADNDNTVLRNGTNTNLLHDLRITRQ
jgi:hypothetical protein